MGAEDNIKTIQSVYEAFGRGDVEGILAVLTDDVDWASEASSAMVPWYGHTRARKALRPSSNSSAQRSRFLSSLRKCSAPMTPTCSPSFTSADPTVPRAKRQIRICITGSDSVMTRSVTTEEPKTHRKPKRRLGINSVRQVR